MVKDKDDREMVLMKKKNAFNPENGRWSDIPIRVDLVAIQSTDPQALTIKSQIVDKVCYFPPKSSEGCKKCTPKFRKLIVMLNN